MNQNDARRFVYLSIATSLRRRAEVLKTGEIGPKATQKDVSRVRVVMRAEADKYDMKLAKRKRTNEPEAGPPGAVEGAHDLPEVDHPAEEGLAPPSER